MARPGSYLYQRKGSRNWHLRLQYPTAGMRQAAHYLFGYMPPKKVERSLGTTDRAEAEVLAGPDILQHRRIVIAYQAMSDPAKYQGRISYEPIHKPGLPVQNEDGSVTIATKDQVIHIAADGRQTITPNTLSPVYKLDMTKVEPFQRRALRELEVRIEKPASRAQPKPVTDVDHEIVEHWITTKQPSQTHINSARNMLALFKEMFPDLTFATADRDDAAKMVKRMEEQSNVSATIKTKLGTLVTAVNLEMSRKNPRVKFNPFSGVARKKKDDTTKRLPLTEQDVKAMEAKRDLFTPDELLMWTFCLNTGMRPAEVFELREEYRETLDHHPITGEKSDIRFVQIERSKTESSDRRIAIPNAVVPLLPKGGIKGALFAETLDNICGRINDKMRLAGITSPDPKTGRERKVFYSTRHRVKARLRNASCPIDIRKAIMGHTKDQHDGYGDETPLWMIKPWIDYLDHTVKVPPTITQSLAVA